MKLEQRNIYGLLGKNGAGKTTMMKLIAGLIFPKGGKIDVIGFIPQERQPQFLADVYFIHEELYVPKVKVTTYEKTYAVFDNYLSEFGLDKDD